MHFGIFPNDILTLMDTAQSSKLSYWGMGTFFFLIFY